MSPPFGSYQGTTRGYTRSAWYDVRDGHGFDSHRLHHIFLQNCTLLLGCFILLTLDDKLYRASFSFIDAIPYGDLIYE